jgi:hypothetical protein
MDPVTALGVASSILQIVDFTQSLVRSTYEVYKSPSGRRKASVDLQAVTSSLKTLNEDLIGSMNRAATVTIGNGRGAELSAKDKELRHLCQKCSDLASTLISALERLTAERNSLWDSFRQALKQVWKEKEILSLEKQLQQYRDGKPFGER